jgi:hypothetical protein
LVPLDDALVDLDARRDLAVPVGPPVVPVGELQPERLAFQLKHGLEMRRPVRRFEPQRFQKPFLAGHVGRGK